jgi:hypothetical protein
LRIFWKRIWINPEELSNTTDEVQKLSGRDHKTVLLIDNLFQLRNPHTKAIEYRNMYYIVSCKSQTYIFLFLDDEYIPEWEEFFSDTLAQRINDTSFNHISVLKKVADKVGGPMQRPILYPDRVALFESDLVEPLVLRGATDVSTVAERQELLNLRAQNANLLRLAGKLRC